MWRKVDGSREMSASFSSSDLLQQHVSEEEEVLMDQEEPEPPWINQTQSKRSRNENLKRMMQQLNAQNSVALRCLSEHVEILGGAENRTVESEEEMGGQSRQQDISWKPGVTSDRMEPRQKHVYKEDEPEHPQIKEEQEEPEPPQIKEEPELPQIKEEQEEPEPPQIEEDQEEPEPPQIKEEPELPQIKEEQEEPEPPQIEEEKEEPDPPQIKEDQVEPELPQIKVEQEDPEPPKIKAAVEIHQSRSETAHQSQEACLTSVNHTLVCAAHALPPRCAAAVLMVEKIPNITGKLRISRVAPAQKTKTGKQKKAYVEKQAKKKELDRARNKTRINIGVAFQRWRELRVLKGFKTDAEFATFLLDKCQGGGLAVASAPTKRQMTTHPIAALSRVKVRTMRPNDTRRHGVLSGVPAPTTKELSETEVCRDQGQTLPQT